MNLGMDISLSLSSRSGGDGTTLNLNMLSGTLDNRVMFTRTTTATFVGSDGLIQLAAVNAPRFDYDPATLVPKGLLMEEQRVNLLLNSLLNGTNLTTQNVTVTASAHTLSFYGTGTVTLSGVSVAVVVGLGVYPTRTTLTFTPTAGVLTVTVTGTVQFANLELGPFASSFIPTAGSQVTRAADFATMTGTNFSSWYNQSEGSFIVDYSRYQNGQFGVVIEVKEAASGTAVNRLGVTVNPATDPRFQNVMGGSVVQDTGSTFGVIAVNSVIKTAVAYKSGDNAATRNGLSPSTSVTTFATQVYTNLQIGQSNNAIYGGVAPYSINGHIRNISYYPIRLNNFQLQILTT